MPRGPKYQFRVSYSQYTELDVLLKALPPDCMKYTARGESRVADIARGETECYIFVTRLSSRAVYFYTNEVAVL